MVRSIEAGTLKAFIETADVGKRFIQYCGNCDFPLNDYIDKVFLMEIRGNRIGELPLDCPGCNASLEYHPIKIPSSWH